MSTPERNPYRGIMHFHSRYSPDSPTTIDRIIAVARRDRWTSSCLTDHDTTAGAGNLARWVGAAGLPLEVPLAAEYRTDHGDLIAAFLREDIVSRTLESFLAEVRGQGGLVLLPHPLVGHDDPEMLAARADLVEVFNGRAGDAANRSAMELAARLGKPGFWASDAHLACSLARTVVTVENRGPLKESASCMRHRAVALPARRRRRRVFLSSHQDRQDPGRETGPALRGAAAEGRRTPRRHEICR